MKRKRVHTSFFITPTSSYIVIIALSLAQPDSMEMIIKRKRHRGHELNSANNYIVTRRRENIYVVFERRDKRKTRKYFCCFRVFKKQRTKKRKLKQTNAKERNIKEASKRNRKTRETKTCGEKKTKQREPRNIFGVFWIIKDAIKTKKQLKRKSFWVFDKLKKQLEN